MKRLSIFLVFLMMFLSKANAQNISNEGVEFWLCFPSHVPASGSGGGLASLSVFITSKNNTSGIVSCGGNVQTFTVNANTVTEVIVPRNNSYINDGTGISPNKGIRVKIDDGKPKAVVYAHVFAGARSAATLVLPVLALGQKYYGISYEESGLGKSQIDIVCVEPNTVLNITPRINGTALPTFKVTLTKVGDVYQYQSDNDITGTYVEVDATNSSCKRFAAFSGSSALAILSPGCSPPGGSTNGNPSYDPLFQQLYPLESWGTSFPLIPFFDRNTGAIFRVLASEDNTKVTIGGNTVVINKGNFYSTTPINTVSVITSDKPVTVAQYAITQYCADSRNYGNSARASDPDMVIINPLEYSIKNVTMYSSDKLAITDQYLNIMIPNSGVASFKLNGADYSNRFGPVPGNSNFSYAQINLGLIGGSNFNLTSDVGFNATAYGFGNFESYAYSAGTNLASSVFINAVRPETNEIIPNACRDEAFDFRLVLPYISDKLIWTLETGDGPITQNQPAYTQIVINGKVLFEYRLPVDKVYNSVGIKKVKIVSTIPPSGGCDSGDETLNFDFEVYDPPPTTTFAANSEACVNSPVQYSLIENNGDRPIISYFWDFGDGETSTDKNPVHSFTSTGTKNVSLYVKNDVACVSNVFTLPINIYNKPVLGFDIEDISCSLVDVQFTDKTNLQGNTISSYLWDFGDSTTSSLQNPKHQYKVPGNYVVSLTVLTKGGCEVILKKNKIIYASPTVDFEDPKACVDDVVRFVTNNKSSNIVSYRWDFGDSSNDVAQNSKEFPAHKYNASGVYTVTLTVESENGCITQLSKDITINAANPKASFSVINPNNLCSNVPVQFQDLSTLSFGNITKLEWIFDYTVAGPNQTVTILDPTPNSIYEFKYPATQQTLNYQVRLRAYSGSICYQDYGPITVTIKGSPEVKFDSLTDTCLNISPFRISEASEITGIVGKGTFSGTGVSADGIFDPALAGVGTFEITYTFIADNGCSDVKTQNITVFPLPTVDAGEDAIILLGGQTKLKGTATGNGLTYKWFPTNGLSASDILDPIASPTENTTYTLMVTSSDGCIILDRVSVIVAGLPKIPNTFTPNNDGVNDLWNIEYLETYVNAKVSIFNRYGNPVFNSIGYINPWDGKSSGKEVPVGVYYYVIDPKNGRSVFTGSVTVIR